jgi:hypothetical protein
MLCADTVDESVCPFTISLARATTEIESGGKRKCAYPIVTGPIARARAATLDEIPLIAPRTD